MQPSPQALGRTKNEDKPWRGEGKQRRAGRDALAAVVQRASKSKNPLLAHKTREKSCQEGSYCSELPTCEKTLLAFDPIIRTVPTTITRITANITEYSAISWPSSSFQSSLIHAHDLLVCSDIFSPF